MGLIQMIGSYGCAILAIGMLDHSGTWWRESRKSKSWRIGMRIGYLVVGEMIDGQVRLGDRLSQWLPLERQTPC